MTRTLTEVATNVSAGGVVLNGRGRVLLVAPVGRFGGYSWTFPKGRVDAGESAKKAAIREVREESGYKCRIVRELGEYRGTTGVTKYYLMLPIAQVGDPDEETRTVAWVRPARAIELLEKTTTAVGRERDLAVLRDAFAADPRFADDWPIDEAITPGLAKALTRSPTKEPCSCGFPMPVYPGRYPKSCPVCGSARSPSSIEVADGARSAT